MTQRLHHGPNDTGYSDVINLRQTLNDFVGPAPTTSAVHNSRRSRDHQQHTTASMVNFPSVSSSSKQLGIQFVNETDSIIADGDCRTYSSLRDAPTPTGRRHNRQTRDYVDESSDSGDDSYDDDVSQLIEFSAVTRRDGSLASGLTGGVSGTGSLAATDGGPRPGKKTKGRVKIKMEFIENKLRRYTTFSKRKTGIMKKAYELSTLTGTQVMLLVASETGHVYTFATRKLQPMITSDSGKALIQTCLNSPDVIPSTSPTSSARHVTSSSPARSEYTDSPQSTSPHGDQVPLPEASQRRQRNMVTSSTGTAEEVDYSYSLNSSSCDTKVNRVVVPNPSVDHVQFNTPSTDQHRGIKRHASTDSEPDSVAAAAGTQRSSSTVTIPSEPQSMPIPTPPQLFYKIPGSNQIVTIPALRPSSNGAGALIYQTPQGLLMASPTPLVGALPGSYFLTPTIQQMPAQQAHSGNTTPLIFTMAQPVGLSSSADGAQNGENLQACAADLRSNQTDARKKVKNE